ncbi:hypothetical protein [Isachenkonia alkalipeptolytica]|uniref:CopZ zinc binding domain-containing protein n=1 Tax=Isachenkonia alkalipeptolytica TaxID=2565777 RepID=A0AA43XMK6_9CLOT|nr:hypothetical protein [Isachenkonia alkalipeptolytica]NBG89603.1 hypothetical protein [Isachenkonia alkalipeptolytica]
MSCSTCQKGCESKETLCPLCGGITHKVVAEEVYKMVKDQLRSYLHGDRFHLCDTEECEVVFHSEDLEEIILIQDINTKNLHPEKVNSTVEEFSKE